MPFDGVVMETKPTATTRNSLSLLDALVRQTYWVAGCAP